MAQILVFGDSIVQGYCDNKSGGWVNKLEIFYMDYNEDFIIYNLGNSGEDTTGLLKRFEFETIQRIDEEETIIIFSIGINDSQFIHSENNLRTIPKKFEGNIRELIKTAKKFSSKIIFLGLNNVIESITTPIPWNSDVSYTNKSIKQFNNILKLICDENKIHFIGIFGLLNKEDFYKDDGVHPNPNGHEKIFKKVKDFLLKQ